MNKAILQLDQVIRRNSAVRKTWSVGVLLRAESEGHRAE
jgi:hypothetical protein